MGWAIVIAKMPPSSPRLRHRLRHWHPFSSPLTRRILAVNLLAPVILVIGVMYLDRYKTGLIRAELMGLTTQAEMIAGALGEGAIPDTDMDDFSINHDIAQQMLHRLAEPAHVRARLYDLAGDLIGDSHYLLSLRGTIQIEPLPEFHRNDLQGRWDSLWDQVMTWMPNEGGLPTYVEHVHQRVSDYPESVAALIGRTQAMVRGRDHGIVMSVAVPVQRYKQVVGALLLTADGNNVARSLFQVRLAIFQVFMGVLLITIMLSLYLAGTIAGPIKRLVVAAEYVRHRRGRRLKFPEFPTRNDEIGELAVAFREMTEALWSRMDAIEAFAADVAHEIKNPLTSVRSAVETVARVSDPVQQQKLLAIIQDDVERLNRLITDISDASRIDAELSRADMTAIALARMLETLLDIYRVTNEQSGLTFALDLPPDDPLTVMGIESRLGQVLRNLIANAISFSPAGGCINLRAMRRKNQICLVIEDQGPGIPPDKCTAIFDRFYSERPEAEKFGAHSGLGLSISKQIIEAHGGTIHAENRGGDPSMSGDKTGARFVVMLPAVE
jgi:two-component system, OmpR family, sensor histidine kinase ChvG